MDYPEQGTCVSYSKYIDMPCNVPYNSISNPNVLAKANAKYCGVVRSYRDPVLSPTALSTNFTVWSGVCIQGSCKACQSYLRYGSSSSVYYDSGIAGLRTLFDSPSGANRLPTLNCLPNLANEMTASGASLGPPRYCKNFQVVQGAATKAAPVSAALLILSVLMLQLL